jgi:uncharacterized protein YdaU (DUF1376 family)
MSNQSAKRKNSPWFAFYPDDFDGGTAAMSLAAVGAFVRLLNYQFAHGFLPKNDEKICRILRAKPREWKAIRDEVISKFSEDENGELLNLRMDEERAIRGRIRDLKIEAGKKGNEKRWQKDRTCDDSATPDAKDLGVASTTTSTSPVLNPKIKTENEMNTSLPSSETYVESTTTVHPEEGGKEDSSISLSDEKKHPFTEDMLLFIARRREIPEGFARTLWLDLIATDFVTANGTRLVSPASYLVACWERQNGKTAQSTPKPADGKREPWMIEADIKRTKAEIAKIQADRSSFNHNGSGISLAEHKLKFEDAWLADLAKLRDAVKRELPAEWAKFEREHAEHVAGMIADKVPESVMGDEYLLARLSEFMPEEVPTFERWDREWNRANAWKDPDKLTAEARTMVRQLKLHVERLEGELRAAMVAV